MTRPNSLNQKLIDEICEQLILAIYNDDKDIITRYNSKEVQELRKDAIQCHNVRYNSTVIGGGSTSVLATMLALSIVSDEKSAMRNCIVAFFAYFGLLTATTIFTARYTNYKNHVRKVVITKLEKIQEENPNYTIQQIQDKLNTDFNANIILKSEQEFYLDNLKKLLAEQIGLSVFNGAQQVNYNDPENLKTLKHAAQDYRNSISKSYILGLTAFISHFLCMGFDFSYVNADKDLHSRSTSPGLFIAYIFISLPQIGFALKIFNNATAIYNKKVSEVTDEIIDDIFQSHDSKNQFDALKTRIKNELSIDITELKKSKEIQESMRRLDSSHSGPKVNS